VFASFGTDDDAVAAAAAGIVLGKHSGRHALASHLHHLGYDLSKHEVDELFKRFKVRQRIVADGLNAIATVAEYVACLTHCGRDC
jgi:isopropylmalate/homocitrate/citramalate synthase